MRELCCVIKYFAVWDGIPQWLREYKALPDNDKNADKYNPTRRLKYIYLTTHLIWNWISPLNCICSALKYLQNNTDLKINMTFTIITNDELFSNLISLVSFSKNAWKTLKILYMIRHESKNRDLQENGRLSLHYLDTDILNYFTYPILVLNWYLNCPCIPAVGPFWKIRVCVHSSFGI